MSATNGKKDLVFDTRVDRLVINAATDDRFGEEIRRQSYPSEAGPSMMDLVFDPETGTFKQVPRNTAAPQQPGTVVTGMTRDGFAA